MGRIPHIREGTVYFLTMVTADRRPMFSEHALVREIIRDNFMFYRKKYTAKIPAYVLMPDHLHCIVALRSPHDLPKWVHDFRSFTAHAANRILKRTGAFWQENYWDHEVRNAHDFSEKVQYIHKNPLEFVRDIEEWPYVSYHNYHCAHPPWFVVDRVAV